MRHPALAALALALFAAGTSSCRQLNNWSTYQRLVAHEREHAAVLVHRYDVALELNEHAAHVVARVSLANGGGRPLDTMRVLLHERAEIVTVRDQQGRVLAREEKVERLGDLVSRAVVVTLAAPMVPGAQHMLTFDYRIASDAHEPELWLARDHGYLLADGLWVPVVHTPLSQGGMDRVPMSLEITLAAPLQPFALPELELVEGADAAPGEMRVFRGATEVRHLPFVVYGSYTTLASDDRGTSVHLLGDPGAPRAAAFVLGALAELRGRMDADFGPAEPPGAQLIVVRRGGASWGAPGWILLDEGRWPRSPDQEYATFELLAHELAHTWWGNSVGMHGRGGYLHEGLANWCAADAVRTRGGDAAAERAWDVWLLRYARSGPPLDEGLGELSMIDEETWQRGAYLVGAHFYRALERHLGRESFVALLRAFAGEHAGGAADLDDLRELARERHDGACDAIFERWVDSRTGARELHAVGLALVEKRTGVWRARTPAPDPALVARVDAVLASACERASGLAALAPSDRPAAAAEALRDLNAMPELQVTVIDGDGDLVFHADGLTGNVLEHRDVRGESVYGSILASEQGTLANFDYLSEDLLRARENAIAWRKLGDLAVVVEGHGWRTIE